MDKIIGWDAENGQNYWLRCGKWTRSFAGKRNDKIISWGVENGQDHWPGSEEWTRSMFGAFRIDRIIGWRREEMEKINDWDVQNGQDH